MAEEHTHTAGKQKPIEVVYRAIDSLRVNPANPRQHSAKQIKQLAASITSFGMNVPIAVDTNLNVIAGHGRMLACQSLGIDQVPTICLEHLSPTQAQAFMIADNRLTEIATWDETLLAEHLKELAALELDFDLEAIGFDVGEIDLRIHHASTSQPSQQAAEAEELPALRAEPISQAGDLWKLGRHFILCGDALAGASYERLLGGQLADVVFTDPPYNVPIAGHASGLGRTKHDDFVMACGEKTSGEFKQFLGMVCANLARHSRDGSIHFICMDWRHVEELSVAGRKTYGDAKNVCVWVKTNAGMGSLYRSQHEFVFVYKNGKAGHQNNVQLGRFGRNRTNVWSYPGAAMPTRGDEERGLLQLHPTVKPVTLVADALMDCSCPGDIVLDPFAGSGTTIIAAERTGRRARVIDLDPRYVDVTIRRWQTFSRAQAIHATTGQPFEAEAAHG